MESKPNSHEGGDRDRRKLTFYFIAEKRIDFRELVRELFRYVSDLPSFWGDHRLGHTGCSRREFGCLLFRRAEAMNSESGVRCFYGSLKRSVGRTC